MTRTQSFAMIIAAGAVVGIASLTVALAVRPAPQHDTTILVGVGCGFDNRIIVWAGEEDDVWPAMCDRIERHAIYAPH